MTAPDLKSFLANSGKALAKGPIAMVFAEDETELNSTLRHHLDTGFAAVLLFSGQASEAPRVGPRRGRHPRPLPHSPRPILWR